MANKCKRSVIIKREKKRIWAFCILWWTKTFKTDYDNMWANGTSWSIKFQAVSCFWKLCCYIFGDARNATDFELKSVASCQLKRWRINTASHRVQRNVSFWAMSWSLYRISKQNSLAEFVVKTLQQEKRAEVFYCRYDVQNSASTQDWSCIPIYKMVFIYQSALKFDKSSQ